MTIEIPVINEKDSAKPVQVKEEVFGQEFNEPLIHQVVITYLANGHKRTKAQKNRSSVSGGGKKPWRQKGTGRARAGTIRSPLWKGGGVTFAAQPGKPRKKINKKMYRSAMRSIISELLRNNRLFISSDIFLTESKTGNISKKLKDFGIPKNTLLIIDNKTSIETAVRNIEGIKVSHAKTVDPVSLIRSEKIIITAEAAPILEERFI